MDTEPLFDQTVVRSPYGEPPKRNTPVGWIAAGLILVGLLGLCGWKVSQARHRSETLAAEKAALEKGDNLFNNGIATGPLIRIAGDRYRDAIALEPKDAVPHCALGFVLLYTDPGAAAREFKAAIRLNPKLTRAYQGSALAFQLTGQVPEALSAWKAAAKLDPTDIKNYDGWARLLASTGRIEEAQAVYQSALQSRPGDMNLIARVKSVQTVRQNLNQEAAAHQRLQNMAASGGADSAAALDLKARDSSSALEAFQLLQRAVRLHPESAPCQRDFGELLSECDLVDLAEKCLRTAISLAPTDPSCHAALADLLTEEYRYKEASQEFAAAVRLNPNDSRSRVGQEHSSRHAGEMDALDKGYRDQIAAHPEVMDAYYSLGCSEFKRHEYQESTRLLRKAVQLAPQSSAAHAMLGRTLLKAGSPDASIAELSRALKLKQQQQSPPQVYLDMASAYQAKGDLVHARAYWQKIVDSGPCIEGRAARAHLAFNL